jgi:uncharacterized protein YgbK (DUF1537 family)
MNLPADVPYPVVFYGDDFTGASANLVEYHRQGQSGVLFVETPTQAQVTRHARAGDIVGIAGVARSLSPADMAAEVRPALELFKVLGARLIQYKLCATFDSSPGKGNFGVVMELAREIFGAHNMPIVAAHPDFGRFTVFGNHFADFQGCTYRLDQHPSMSRHPQTPMNEADLRRHLARQTELPIGLCDLFTLRSASLDALQQLLENNDWAGTVFDALEHQDLVTLAAGVWRAAQRRSIFVLGSHGFAAGLAPQLRPSDPGNTVSAREPQGPVDQLVVLSGSCSPRTAAQIEYARAQGWADFRLPLEQIAQRGMQSVVDSMCGRILSARAEGRSVVVYAASGPDDATISVGRGIFDAMARESSAVIGQMYGEILKQLVSDRAMPRIMLAGGDTSSQTVRALGIEALTVDAINPSSTEALMRMHAEGNPFDGSQVLMKAGQNGSDDYFIRAQLGTDWI